MPLTQKGNHKLSTSPEAITRTRTSIEESNRGGVCWSLTWSTTMISHAIHRPTILKYGGAIKYYSDGISFLDLSVCILINSRGICDLCINHVLVKLNIPCILPHHILIHTDSRGCGLIISRSHDHDMSVVCTCARNSIIPLKKTQKRLFSDTRF